VEIANGEFAVLNCPNPTPMDTIRREFRQIETSLLREVLARSDAR